MYTAVQGTKVRCGVRENDSVAVIPWSSTARSGMGMGMFWPYCSTRCRLLVCSSGTFTPSRRASRWIETHPSPKKALKASRLDGRSSGFIAALPPSFRWGGGEGYRKRHPEAPGSLSFTSRESRCQMLVGRDIVCALPSHEPTPIYALGARVLALTRAVRVARAAGQRSDSTAAAGGFAVRAGPDPPGPHRRQRGPGPVGSLGLSGSEGRRQEGREERQPTPPRRRTRRWAGRSSPRRWPPCARSIGWPIWACGWPRADKSPPELSKSVDFLLDSQEPDGGIADLALAETPKGRAKMVALHFQGWAMSALCRAGLRERSRGSRGACSSCWSAGRMTAAGPGAGCAPIQRRAPVQPPGDRHGAAGVRLGHGPARLARGPPRGRVAGHALPAARSLPRPQGAGLLGDADRAALLHRRARRPGHGHRHRARQGELRRAHRRGLPALAAVGRRPVVPRPPAQQGRVPGHRRPSARQGQPRTARRPGTARLPKGTRTSARTRRRPRPPSG